MSGTGEGVAVAMTGAEAGAQDEVGDRVQESQAAGIDGGAAAGVLIGVAGDGGEGGEGEDDPMFQPLGLNGV